MPFSLFLSLPPSQRTLLTEAVTDSVSDAAGTESKATRSLNRSLAIQT